MIPTNVVFIIKIPSVNTEIAWVSLATLNKEEKIQQLQCMPSTLSFTDLVYFISINNGHKFYFTDLVFFNSFNIGLNFHFTDLVTFV